MYSQRGQLESTSSGAVIVDVAAKKTGPLREEQGFYPSAQARLGPMFAMSQVPILEATCLSK